MISAENPPSGLPKLTEMEKRCLALAADGGTPADIARETDLPLAQVNAIMRGAVDKLDTRNVTGAIARAVRLDLI